MRDIICDIMFSFNIIICDYIQKAHDDYIERKHDVADDITHIVEVNRRAIEGMIEVLARKSENHRLKHS